MSRFIALIKKYKTTLIIGSVAIMVAQCAGTKSTTKKVDSFLPQETDVPIAQAHWNGTTIDQLKQGYSIYSTKCVECHDMKNIQDFTLTDWPGIIEGMSRKAKLSPEQRDLVSHYILARREALGK